MWRILVGVSLAPAFGTLYQRLTLPESTRYKASQQQAETEAESLDELKNKPDADPGVQEHVRPAVEHSRTPSPTSLSAAPSTKKALASPVKREHWAEFLHYFSEWRHFRVLLGTCACWFLLDIAFYGINLNQNVVLEEIGFDGKSGSPWTRLFKIGLGNLIVTALGFVPGYYVSILTIEWLGRKWIQIQGFLLAALFCECDPVPWGLSTC